jgi:hypothetical protein
MRRCVAGLASCFQDSGQGRGLSRQKFAGCHEYFVSAGQAILYRGAGIDDI